jgi:tungstate transport system permease protein
VDGRETILGEAISEAYRLIISRNPALLHAIVVTHGCSLGATTLAVLLGTPLGIVLGRRNFPGRGVILVLFNTAMALPTVVVGLFCYALLSRRCLAGSLGLLYTCAAIVIGETLLAVPIVVSLFSTAVRQLDPRMEMAARTLGASRVGVFRTVLHEGAPALLTSAMAAFGRVVSELGIALMLGGNIEGYTQTLTGMIAFQSSKGEFALAMAAGVVLLVIALGINLAVQIIRLSRGGTGYVR